MQFAQFLTGSSNDYVREAAETDLYGRVGLMIQPETVRYAKHIGSYASWAMDNGCYSKQGEFNGERFLRDLDRIVQETDGAHEKCLFATAPDVFDPVAKKGDPVATLKRSAPYYQKIRETGAPVALVAQDGLQNMIEEIPWGEFDVLFIGGSDEFKLGYPDFVPASNERFAGNPHYATNGNGAISEETRSWCHMIARAHEEGKPIHVGRVNTKIRFHFSYQIGADSFDGTLIARSGRDGLARLRRWFAGDSFDLRAELGFEIPSLPLAA